MRDSAPPAAPKHLKNSYASETPVTDGERVYVYFGNVGLFAFDMNGKPVWSKPIGPFKTRYGWGTAASPVLHRDRVYIVNDNDDQSFLAAYDKRTGDEIWRVNRDEGHQLGDAVRLGARRRTEIVTAGTGKVRSYDLTGKLLWEFKGMSIDQHPDAVRPARAAVHQRPATSATRCGRRTRSVPARRATSR